MKHHYLWIVSNDLPVTKNIHGEHFNLIHASMDLSEFSFIPNTIYDWNAPPHGIIQKYLTAENRTSAFVAMIRKRY